MTGYVAAKAVDREKVGREGVRGVESLKGGTLTEHECFGDWVEEWG